MKYLAACTVILGCVMLANPAFAGGTRIIIQADLGLFGGSHYRDYDRHYSRHYDRRYDRYYDRHRNHRAVIIHRAPRVIFSPFSTYRDNFWHDNGRRGYNKHWKRNDRHDNRRYRGKHRDRHYRRH